MSVLMCVYFYFSMKNPLWFIIWLILLIVSLFIAGFCAGWYILIYPLTVCVPALSVRIKRFDVIVISSNFYTFQFRSFRNSFFFLFQIGSKWCSIARSAVATLLCSSHGWVPFINLEISHEILLFGITLSFI